MCGCVCERERARCIQKTQVKNFINKKQNTRITNNVIKEMRRCLYISHILSIFSFYNHLLIKRGGELTTLNMRHRTIRFYDTMVIIVGGGVFTH